MEPPSRRTVLRASGLALVGGVAGCSGDGSSADSDGGTDASGSEASETSGGQQTETMAMAVPEKPEPPEGCSSPTKLQRSDVSGGTTVEAGCYRVTEPLEVADGTLVLSPGAYLQFPSDTGLTVKSGGELRAEGTVDDPVVLSGVERTRGGWKGLQVVGGASATLEGTVLEYGGGDRWDGSDESFTSILARPEASLTVQNSLVCGSENAGLVVRKQGVDLSLSQVVFAANATPAWVHAETLSAFGKGVGFRNNDESYVRVTVTGARDHVVSEQRWQDPGVPFRVGRNVQLNASVTVEAGVEMVFESEAGLNVKDGGQLVAAGDPDRPVVFRGTGDGRGEWFGIQFVGTTGNRLANAVVAGGGENGWTGDQQSEGGVYARGNDLGLTVEGTTFRNNHNAGLLVDAPGADLTVADSTFEANHRPLWVEADNVPDLEDLTFTGNDQSQVFVGFSNGPTAVSEAGTWGDLGVPYRPARLVNVDAKLEIEPGVTLKFESGTGVQVRGSGQLTAVGAADDPVRFVGNEEKNGHWRGISFKNTTKDNRLAQVHVKHGGGRQWHGFDWSGANVFVHGGRTKARVTLGKTTVTDSGWHGISIGREAEFGCGSPEFAGNKKLDSYSAKRDGPIPGCQ